MAFIDKADFKAGFWIGLGVILALMVVSFFQLFLMRLRARNG